MEDEEARRSRKEGSSQALECVASSNQLQSWHNRKYFATDKATRLMILRFLSTSAHTLERVATSSRSVANLPNSARARIPAPFKRDAVHAKPRPQCGWCKKWVY
eukprot:5022484-Pleurochrysis_carterae.AAC.1